MSTTPAAAAPTRSFDRLWDDLLPVGRDAGTGGYRRYAWTPQDAQLREWFTGECASRGLDVVEDRAGNLWGWWGDPDAAVAAGRPGVVVGSHLDSVPDGGAYDGPLGVVSALAAVDALRAQGHEPAVPIGVACFGDEEGARFGIACAGSRLLTGQLTPDRALALRDADGVTMAQALDGAGRDPRHLGRDEEALARVGTFVELHVEQGRALADADRYDQTRSAVAVGSDIWPHGRWRLEVPGRADHAGTTRLDDRDDAMLTWAGLVLDVRRLAQQHGCVATNGKVRVEPGGVNAIPSRVTGWLDARGADEDAVRRLVDEIAARAAAVRTPMEQESWTPTTRFDTGLVAHLAGLLGDAPVLGTGAGHDAGILAQDGRRTAMLFVRNPTGTSHSPDEHAERDDCHAGVAALATVLADLTGAEA
ncbi:allantoate amidohydrolase [Lapillicoccus jejuensis]|uniref:N-carbamoyl-L-amino-acid hydrolase n=1 Tax=Lapillicoccus jejuensis TaxID=402171 RepID=A0A542DZU1_9MICO|nr:allantoate amidohydrolase [Lapillicoccus jejuensis]TQJ08600.1 N-carbamoyl-L-amino-acid hydrolase [Lapillicoccus jejuensis]